MWFDYQRQISHGHLPRSDRSCQAKFTPNLRRPFPNYDSLYNKSLIWEFSFSAQDVWKPIGFRVNIEPAVCFGTSIIFDLHLIRKKMRRGQISPVCSARYSETRTSIHWLHPFTLEQNKGHSTKKSGKWCVWYCLDMWIYKSAHYVLFLALSYTLKLKQSV